MSNSIARDDPSVKVIVGVDTHKHEHVAVAINDLGAGLATFRVPANGAGYADLVAWARTLGDLEAFGVKRHSKLTPWRHRKLTPEETAYVDRQR